MEYPSYQEIEEYVTQHPEYLEHWPVYSETYHARMAKIFDMLWRTRDGPELRSMKVATRGLQIFHDGGMAALVGCFYIFVAALRLRLQQRDKHDIDSLRIKVLGMRTALNYMWEGIGEWSP